MALDDISHQYDRIVEDYQKTKETILNQYVIIPTFLELGRCLKNKNVIDLACGAGYSTRLLKEQIGVNKLIGLDISEEQIKLARKIEKQSPFGISYLVGDVANFDFSSLGFFDAATAVFLLHYFPTEEQIFLACKNIYSILNEDGTFIILNNNPENPIQPDKKYGFTSTAEMPLKEGDKKRITYYLEDERLCSFYAYHWGKNALEGALKKAGFNRVEWHNPIISEQGIKKFGEEFWQDFRENPNIITLEVYK
jgi:ubiquinone/menaquinone biosynthesis C-methylase UbiE